MKINNYGKEYKPNLFFPRPGEKFTMVHGALISMVAGAALMLMVKLSHYYLKGEKYAFFKAGLSTENRRC